MKKIVKNLVFLAAYNMTRAVMLRMEDKMRKEGNESKDRKVQAAILGTIHTALGILYND